MLQRAQCRAPLLLLVQALSFATRASAESYSPLSTTVCSAAGTSTITAAGVAGAGGGSIIPALPRRDRTGTIISSDIGSYSIFTCGSGLGTSTFPCALPTLPPVSALYSQQQQMPGSVFQYVRDVKRTLFFRAQY